MSKTTPKLHNAARALAGVVTAVALAACAAGDIPTSPLRPLADNVLNNIDNTGFVRVCKQAGPVGAYTFQTTVNGGGAHLVNFGFGPTLVLNFEGTPVCLNTYVQLRDPSWTEGLTGTVTIAELVPDGIDVEKIEVWDFSVFPEVLLQTITDASSVTVTVNATTIRKILFYNKPETPPPPPGREGCTPGYWKNHLNAWAATGYSTGQTLESVFDVPDALGLDNMTLLAALSTGGGGATALLRHAVAAILGAAHPGVDYPQSAADIIAAVNAALASGNATTIESLQEGLDNWNNLNAPGFCD